MTEQDILSYLKEQVRAELGREANETIEKLVHKFRCELGKHRNTLIAEMLHRIEIVTKQNDSNQNLMFQVNIKSDSPEVINQLKTEIEKLKEENKILSRYEGEMFKDFADKLKSKVQKPEHPWEDNFIFESDIDEVLKEMECD